MNKKELQKAFSNTNYIILKNEVFKDDVVIKIGVLIDIRSVLPNCTQWAFITAWNPLPEKLTDLENEKRNASLLSELKTRGFESHFGIGVSQNGQWSEKSFFIENVCQLEAMSIAKLFGQLAIVYCGNDQIPQLFFTK